MSTARAGKRRVAPGASGAGSRGRSASSRVNDPEGTRRNILEVATQEFSKNGLSGSRIDEIAALTRTSKRMIYYYFGDKDGLYLAVLEAAYHRIRAIESTLDLEHLEPRAALKALVEFTFDYQNANSDFIRLVMIENIHHGAMVEKSRVIQELNVTVIDAIRSVYERGRKAGVFRKGIDPIDLHWAISALCFFNVSNRATFSKIFKRDMGSAKALAARRGNVVELIERYVVR
jgi:AcrR family transcriptional regulator